MDAATRTSLEILRSRDGGTQHTLLSTVQRTVTAAGARLLAGWIAAPLTDRSDILARQDAWAWGVSNLDAINRLRKILRTVPDIKRALGRLSLNRGTPRDLAAIRDGLKAGFEAAGVLQAPLPPALADAKSAIPSCSAMVKVLERALADPVPARLEDGGAIRSGYDGELDAHRTLRDESRQVIARLQLDFAQRFGVASLKIRHHAQLGYIVEAPSVAVDKLRVFSELTLRQGMANGARFTTPELSELDQQIRDAADRATARERLVFNHLVQEIVTRSDEVAACADALAFLDVTQSAAKLAEGGSWVRPVVTLSDEFRIKAGRHPVVEHALNGRASFVPN